MQAERLAESLKHPSLLASSQPPAPPLATTLQDGMLNIEAMSIDFDGWVKAGPDVAKRDAVKAVSGPVRVPCALWTRQGRVSSARCRNNVVRQCWRVRTRGLRPHQRHRICGSLDALQRLNFS